MRTFVLLPAVCAAAFASSAALAQTESSEPSVESYLCTFAGKCGDSAAPAPDGAVRAAPATKGFSLARPVQTQAAPATKGFSLARPSKTEPAPATRGFSLAKPTNARVSAPAVATRSKRVPTAAKRARAAAAVAAVAPVSVGAGVSRRADLMVSFELNSDKLTPAGENRAKIFAETLLRPELIDKRFLIAGHTDSLGTRAANSELSRRRAQAVADYLARAGVERARLEVKGQGSAQPLPGHRVTDPANRRVEAELIS